MAQHSAPQAPDEPAAAGHDNYAHHQVAGRTYAIVFGVLCAMTFLMLGTYTNAWRSVVEPQTTRGFLLLLSIGQALLVVLFLMHLKYEAAWKYVLTIPTCIIAVLLMLMLVPDVGLRMYRYSMDRWTQSAVYDGAAFYISQLLPTPDDMPLSRTARDEEKMPNVNVGPQPAIEPSQPPIETAPVEDEPNAPPAAEEPSANEAPADAVSSAEDAPPADDASSENAPVEASSAEASPTEDASTDAPADEEVPAQEASADEAPQASDAFESEEAAEAAAEEAP